MTIEFRCGQCNQLLRVPDNSAGKNARCPKCQALMQVPAASPESAALGVPGNPAPQLPLPGQSLPPAPTFVAPAPPPPKSDDPFAFLNQPAAGAPPAKGAAAPPSPFGNGGFGGPPVPVPAPSFGQPAFGNPPAVNPYATPGGGYGAAYSGTAIDYGPRSGLPWEVKGQSFSSWWETMSMIIGSPSLAFSRMRQYGGLGSPIMFAVWGLGVPVAVGMCIMIPIMILLGIGIGNEGGAGLGIGFGAGMIVALLIGAVVYVFLAATVGALIAAAIYHLCLLMVGGARQPFETTFRVVSFVQGGITPVGLVLAFIPYLGGLIHMIWMIVLLIIGLAKAHEVSTGKAAGAVLLPFAVMMMLCVGLMFLSFLGALAGN